MNDIDKFIKNILNWTLILTFIGYLIFLSRSSADVSLGWLLGSMWNWINFYLLYQLIPIVIRPREKEIQKKKLIKVCLGFGVLFLVGFLILNFGLSTGKINPWSTISGFSLLFVVITLKGVGNILFSNPVIKSKI